MVNATIVVVIKSKRGKFCGYARSHSPGFATDCGSFVHLMGQWQPLIAMCCAAYC